MFDAFVKIAGVEGESSDAAHVGQIEILTYSHSLNQTATMSNSTSGAAPAGRVNYSDFKFTKGLDKTSPLLARLCASGSYIQDVEVHLCRAGGEKQVFYVYKFERCLISSVTRSGDGHSGENLPVEEVTINFGRIEEIYNVINPDTGTTSGAVQGGWDLSANVSI